VTREIARDDYEEENANAPSIFPSITHYISAKSCTFAAQFSPLKRNEIQEHK
jgi:hypothetical protein